MPDYTLHLGDCLEYMATMPDASVDVVITDPPYGIAYASSRTMHRDGVTLRRTAPSFGVDKYSPAWIPAISRIMKNNSLLFFFTRWDMAHLVKADGEAAGLVCAQRLIWDKLHWGMGDLRFYGSQTEDALLFRKGSPRMMYDKRMGNIWRYPSKAYFPEGCYDHPSQKPLGVIEEWIRHSTRPGDTVLDPFMGSGTTGVACMNTGRKFIGIELNAGYFKIAKKRIEEATWQPALLREAAD